jgi:hypothetical protein
VIDSERRGLRAWYERGDRRRTLWSSGLLAVFALSVLAITLTPEPVDRGMQPTIVRVLSALHNRGLPEWFGYAALEFGANVALFVPLAFLIGMALPLRLWWVPLAVGPGLSVVIEVTQAVALSARFASVGDVVANSLGTVIGTGIALAFRVSIRLLLRRGLLNQRES